MDLLNNQDESYIYLERYVNNGSPSGFTDIHKTSFETNQYTGKPQYPILQFSDYKYETRIWGEELDFLHNLNYAHPDSRNSSVLKSAHCDVIDSDIIVSPTSSGRTMLIRSKHYNGFIKLNYDIARIGRVDRQLTLNHCLSSFEVTNTLKNCIDNNSIGNQFSLLLDKSWKVSFLHTSDKIYEWGVILRDRTPYPYKLDSSNALIPGFSLFGKDRLNDKDEYLIIQLIEKSLHGPSEYLRNILQIVVNSYWQIVLKTAFHIECHGQNCLFEFDNNYNIIRMVLRDMDSVDKDIELAKKIGLRYEWESFPYLCLNKDIYYYPIRSSYMYDFKLGEYLLDPLINIVCSKYELDMQIFYNYVKEIVNDIYLPQLPSDYFTPDGKWYKADNTERLSGQKRQYFSQPNPKFR